MRLTREQIDSIKQTAQQVLGEDARVTLFGSRADDNRRGGDIDLLFETSQHVAHRTQTLNALYVALIRRLGDRKLDILLKDPATPDAPVLRVARETGVQL
ncbi:MAG: nucleotidyltransferase domain-containing protein [Hydrogenophaga sp.]|nr:nucleotidyltransferase domain-containing protein [Hydrogenophaga sp.]